MTCDQTRTLMGAYFDGELDLLRSVEIEEHLSTCPACTGKLDDLRGLRKAAGAPGLYYSAPPALADRLHAALRDAPVRHYPLRGLALAAMIAIVVGSGALLIWRGRESSQNRQVAADIVAAHVRSVMGGGKLHLMDVESNDQHNVKPWFIGKVDFAPDVLKLDERGFPLKGGRLDYVGGHPAAVLVYGARQHVINLFLWPAAAGGRAGDVELAIQGYHLRHWAYENMECWAITDASPETLRQFEQAYVSR